MPPPPPFSPQPEPVSQAEVTSLLLAWADGDAAALDALLPVVYAELRAQARRAMRREGAGHTLQTTALVHEAYLRLIDQRRVTWRNRAQFFGIAAQLMRRVLVDHARTRNAEKRGGGSPLLTLGAAEQAAVAAEDDAVDVLALHDALERLAALDPEQARLVELRYFGGLTIEDTAAALGVSRATVNREWAIARAWLRRELAGARGR
jgi:RNA polymerase sigma-70 factor, ECF subfamily